LSLNSGWGTHFCLSCLWPKRFAYSERCHSCVDRARPPINEETRAKMKSAKLGNHASEATKVKMGLAHLGHPTSEETRRRIGIGRTGILHTDECKKRMSASHKGTHPSKEAIENQRLATIARKLIGEKSPHWRGGISLIPYAPEFRGSLRESIRERDGFICQNPKCYVSENGRKHSVHHIDFVKANHAPENLIALCTSCHTKTASGDRAYWTEYYQNIQSIRGIA
jgi:5-methylcytosine-specific restriction endonuclease McrA